MKEIIDQLRAAGYHNVGLDLDRWYSPGSQPFDPTLTLEQAQAQLSFKQAEETARIVRNRETFIKQKVWRTWADTRAGKAFHRYDSLIGAAWIADCRSHGGKSLTQAWDKAEAAKVELIAAIRELQGFDFDSELAEARKALESPKPASEPAPLQNRLAPG